MILIYTYFWPALVVANVIIRCHTAEILGIFPFPSKSHHYVISSLMRELSNRGHNVTVISAFPQDRPLPNYTDILVESNIQDIGTTDLYTQAENSRLTNDLNMFTYAVASCDKILQQRLIQNLIHSIDQHYNLIIIETFFSECFYGFAHKFNAPIVAVCAFGGTNYIGNIVGNPSPYSYVPDPFVNYGDHMTFIERLYNTVVGTLTLIGRDLYYIPLQDALMRKHFNNSTMPYLAAIERSTSVLLVNNHVSLNYPKPLVPNFVEVGGLHIKTPKKLPQDIQKFLDEAPEGVVYFSMGSLLKSSSMPQYKRQAFVDAFSKLNRKVLWKWDTDFLPGQPPNVKVEKWLPQPDVLAHKNVHLFITHGGLISMQEAIYHGVPLVGIPVFADQKMNMIKAKSSGTGLFVDYNNISAETLSWTIQEVLNTPSYKGNAERLSGMFRDRPEPPMELAVYWIEYVVRHKGASHLQSAALDLTWYECLLLDVVAVIVSGVSVGLLSTYLCFQYIYKQLINCESTQRREKKKVQKKKN